MRYVGNVIRVEYRDPDVTPDVFTSEKNDLYLSVVDGTVTIDMYATSDAYVVMGVPLDLIKSFAVKTTAMKGETNE